ncbi:unnamed protein product [Penicillium pancosmium]
MGAVRPALIDFQVIPATQDDCLSLAQVEAIAFDNSKKEPPGSNTFQIMFGSYSDVGNEFRRGNFLEKMKTDPTARFWKAVIKDENGLEKIIGWARWHYFTEPKTIEPLKKDIPWPATANRDACNHFIGAVELAKKKHMDGKRFGFLQVLATLPEYCGKGVGSALLRQGLSTGRELGLSDYWIDASADGHDLYAKFGFVDTEPVILDVEKYGGVGTICIMGMRKTE